MAKKKEIGKLTKDWFDRRAEDSFMKKTAPRSISWDRDRENLSSYFIKDDSTTVSDAATVVSTMFSVLDIDKHKKLSKVRSEDTSKIKLPLGMLKTTIEDEGVSIWDDKIDFEKLDAFYGASIQNGAMHSLQSSAEYSKMLVNRRKSGYDKSNKVNNLLSDVINTERVNEKIGKKYPGYSKFVQKYKDYAFDKNYTPLPEDAPDNARFLDLVIRMLRYPSHITDDELEEFGEPLSKIERYIKKFNGIPETGDECDSMAKSISKIIYKYVEEEPPPPPSDGGGDDTDKDSTEDDKHDDSDSTKDSGGEGDGDSDSDSESSKGDSSEGGSDDDGKADSSDTAGASAEKDGGDSASSGKEAPLSKSALDDMAKEMMDDYIDTSEDMEDVTGKDIKKFEEEMEEKDSSIDEEDNEYTGSGVSNSPIFFKKSDTNSRKYNNIRKSIDFTKAHVFRTMFERKAKDFDYAIKGMKTGRLDPNKIAEAVQGVPTVYEKVGTVSTNKVLIGVLVDESGSMGGSRIQKAREAAIYINEIFKKMGAVDLYIYGHTGDQHEKASRETMIRIYKEKGIQEDPAALGSIEARSQNRDGFAILATARRIRNISDHEGILFVISDGQPAATGYSGKNGIKDTREKVKLAEALGFQVIQIAIEEDVPSKEMFTHYIKMVDIDTFPKDLAKYMARKVDKLMKTSYNVMS